METDMEIINRLVNRHIAKLLNDLGDSIPQVIQKAIKKEFRYLQQDIENAFDGVVNDEQAIFDKKESDL